MRLTSTHLLFLLVGFVTDFTSLAEFYLLREIGLDVASCYAAATVINIPWSLRPLWGHASDLVGHRHAQLAVIFFCAFAVWMALRTIKDSAAAVIAALLVAEVAAAAGLTIADAYVVRLTKKDDAAMPKHHRFRILGRILASFLSGHMLAQGGVSHDAIATVFLVQSVVFLVAAPLAALFLQEDDPEYDPVPQKEESDAEAPKAPEAPPLSPAEYVREVLRIAWANPPIRFLVVVFTVYAALPDSNSAFSYFLVGPLRVSPLTLGSLEAVRGACDFLGTFVRTDVPPEKALTAMLSVANVLCVPMVAVVCRAVAGWLDDRAILFATTAVSAWVASAFATVFTVAVAKVSPHGKEGGTFNGILSIPSAGTFLGFLSTYALTRAFGVNHDDFSRLPDFVALTSLLGCAGSLAIAAFA